MANTFKLKTKATVTTLATVYTVPASTTSIVLGLMIGNTTGSAVTTTVTVDSDTVDTETNAAVELLTTTQIPGYSSLEVMGGNKIVLQTTDMLKVTGSGAVDVCLSVMEIT